MTLHLASLSAVIVVKRWTDYDERILSGACETGKLPDGQIATQWRLARFLGFSRQTVVVKLAGRRFPLSNELKAEGARNASFNRMARRSAPSRAATS